MSSSHRLMIADTLGEAMQSPLTDTTRRVLVRALVVDCHIGVHAHEHGRTQRVRVNLDLTAQESSTPIADDLRNVVCYDEIIAGVRALAQRQHVRLIETLAEQIAELCLADHRVLDVLVTVEKLDVYSDAESVGISILRRNPLRDEPKK